MTEQQESSIRQALEALERTGNIAGKAYEREKKAIIALRWLLKCAAQQEPVAWMYQCSADSSGPVLSQHKRDWAESGSGLWTETPLYTHPPARETEQQEPVAWLYKSPMPDGSVFVGASAERLQIGVGVTPDSTEQPLYTGPQARESEQPTIPKGWKLVPVKPTAAWTDRLAEIGYNPRNVIQQVLNAAPTPPQGE